MLSLSSEELQRLNNLRDENIFEGDVLAVSAVSAGTGCTTGAKYGLCDFSAHVLSKDEAFMRAQLKRLACFFRSIIQRTSRESVRSATYQSTTLFKTVCGFPTNAGSWRSRTDS